MEQLAFAGMDVVPNTRNRAVPQASNRLVMAVCCESGGVKLLLNSGMILSFRYD